MACSSELREQPQGVHWEPKARPHLDFSRFSLQSSLLLQDPIQDAFGLLSLLWAVTVAQTCLVFHDSDSFEQCGCCVL